MQAEGRRSSACGHYNLRMREEKRAVTTGAAPAAIGPYTQAVVVGAMLYTSGQVGLDPEAGQMVVGGVEEQTRQVLQNLKAVLEAGGSSLAEVVKTVVYLKSMDDFAAMNAIYAEYLVPAGGVAPARSTVEVARLPKDALVEIDAVALSGRTVPGPASSNGEEARDG